MTREQFENIAKLAVMEAIMANMANYDRDCDTCIHHVTRDDKTGCESWECEYERREE